MKVVSPFKKGETKMKVYSKHKNSGKELSKEKLKEIERKIKKTGVYIIMNKDKATPLTAKIKTNYKEGDTVVAFPQPYISSDCIVVLYRRNGILNLSKQEIAKNLEISKCRGYLTNLSSLKKKYLNNIFRTYIFLKSKGHQVGTVRFEELTNKSLEIVASRIPRIGKKAIIELREKLHEELQEISYSVAITNTDNFLDKIDLAVEAIKEQVKYFLRNDLDFDTDNILSGDDCFTTVHKNNGGKMLVSVTDLFKGNNYKASLTHLKKYNTKKNRKVKTKNKEEEIKELVIGKPVKPLFYLDPKFCTGIYDPCLGKGYRYNGVLTQEMKNDGLERKAFYGFKIKDRISKEVYLLLQKRKSMPALYDNLPEKIKKKLRLNKEKKVLTNIYIL